MRDSLKHGDVGSYVSTYNKNLAFDWQTRVAALIQRYFGLQGMLARRLASRFQKLEAGCTVLQDLSRTGARQFREMIGEEATAKLADILNQRSMETSRALQSLRACYPDYATELEKRTLQQTAMRLELGQYNEMRANSLIGKEVTDNLQEQMSSRYKDIQQN